jgi:hypothetical protein
LATSTSKCRAKFPATTIDGTACNSSPRITRSEEYSQTKIVLTAAEHCHFSFGSVQEHHLLAELRPVVKAFARGGIRKPHDVARALNKAGKRTACGEHWTPRLVWFLLSNTDPRILSDRGV